ncbi:MAG: hypothetical protein Q9209_003535 [Squamulea sp. 1 TL-2023]
MLTNDVSTKTSVRTINHSTGGCRKTQIKIRLLAAIPRSGSTLFMQIFREAPECAVTSRLILMGNYGMCQDFRPDYTIFHDPRSHPVYQEAKSRQKSILISKEELGHDCFKGECDYKIFPDDACMEQTKAAFLFRDPIRVFDSWKAVGWTDIQSLLIAYRNLFNTWATGQHSAIAVTYEEMINQPEQTIQRLCRRWDVNYSHRLLSFEYPFGDFLFSSERERQIYTVDNPLGLFNTVQSNKSINAHIKSHGLLTTAEKDLIEQQLGGLYMATYGDSIQPIKQALSLRTHFGFDLDDTLHEFRKASGTASVSVFNYLAAADPSTTVAELTTTYSKILSQITSGAFADGKTSDDYRRERFIALMQAHAFQYAEGDLRYMLTLYKDSLQSSLTLKSGASELLGKLKAMGKTVVVITEGPEDAQQWTLENLHIADKVDVLFTSNRMGKSKTDGLFGQVLRQLGIGAEKMVFVGDSLVRDILPASKEGVMTVHYDEAENLRLEMGSLRINSMWKLNELLC